MTHETFREMLPLYVIGALDGDELYNFERYVAENREICHAELAEYQAIADQIALSAPSAQPSPVVYERIVAAIEEPRRPSTVVAPAQSVPAARQQPESLVPGGWIFRFIPWAAAAVLLVLLASAYNQIRTRDGLLQSMTASYNELLAKNKDQEGNLAKQRAGTDQQAKEFQARLDQLTAANQQQQHDIETLHTANRELTDEKDAVVHAADQMREQLEKQSLQTAALQKKIDDQSGTLDMMMDPSVRVAPLTDPKGETKALGKVYWVGSKRTGMMIVSNVTPVAEGQGKCLELWAICGNEPPVPAGIGYTDDSGYGRLQIKPAKDVACVDKFAVTVERSGGVPAPEGSIILIGQ